MNTEILSPYGRLQKIMDYFELNPNSFAKKIGLKRTQNLYDIRDGKVKKISIDLANKITTVFTVINRDWILDGSGEMELASVKQLQPNKEVDTVDEIGSIIDVVESEVLENSFGNKFEKLPNGQYLMYMPLFEWDVAASLLDNEGDTRHPDYADIENYIAVVEKPLQGKYSAFRIKGGSMEGVDVRKFIPDGSIVWGRELQPMHWKDKLRINKYPLWVIGSTEFGRPTLKEIVRHDTEKAVITVDSWNPSLEYAHNVDISLNTVKMLFYIMKVESSISEYY